MCFYDILLVKFKASDTSFIRNFFSLNHFSSITSEDKYGTAPINSACGTDEDEEFLKSNETMKDITPPKLAQVVQQPLSTSVSSSVAKQLYPTASPLFNSFNKTTEVKTEVKSELADLSLINGLLATPIENKPGIRFAFETY